MSTEREVKIPLPKGAKVLIIQGPPEDLDELKMERLVKVFDEAEKHNAWPVFILLPDSLTAKWIDA